jgi:hypothetical protein
MEDDECNGIISNYTIIYADVNNCGTYNNTPINNGTIINCCVENWSANYSDCIGFSNIIYYTDTNNCNTSYTMPLNNGTHVKCGDFTGAVIANTVTGITNMIIVIIIIAIIGVLAVGFGGYIGIIEKDLMIKLIGIMLIGAVLLLLGIAFRMFVVVR